MPVPARSAVSLKSRPRIFSIAAIFCAMVSLADSSPANAAAYAFTRIDVPGATRTGSFGINNTAQVVGPFTDSTGTHSFLYGGGSFTQIDVPSAIGTSANDINDAGQIVGDF